MASDPVIWVMRPFLQSGAQALALRRVGLPPQGVAQGHRQIAQPARMANAANGRAFGVA